MPEIQEVQSKYLTVFPNSSDLIVKIILATSLRWGDEINMAKRMCEYITTMVPEYAKVFWKTDDEMLALFETDRDYSAPNYYQKAKQPSLENVVIYKSKDEFYKKHPDKKYICPKCWGHSDDPQTCSVKPCDWKSYGLFWTMGSWIKILFLNQPWVPSPVEIFKPINFTTTI